MRRLIFVNAYFAPDRSATSQLLTDAARHLAARRPAGEVQVVASPFLYQDMAARLPAREVIEGVHVRRVAATRLARFGLVGRAVDQLVFLASAGIALWRLCRPGDVVIAKTDPPFLALLADLLARWRGVVALNWLQDVYPEIAGVLNRRVVGLLAPPLIALRNRCWRRAAANLVIGEAMAERLRQAAVPPERIIRVENWADGIAIRPVPPADNPLRAVWGVADAVVVGYSGNLGRVHLAAPLVALIRTIGADEGIRFLFIGGGAQLGRLEADLARQRGRTFLCQPAQPRERLAQSLSVPDIHLVTLRPELEGAVVPSKLYGIMAAGRPTVFVGAPDGEVARTLARHGCGIAVAPDDPAGLVAAIRRLAADAEERARLGAAARQAFEQHYDRPLALAKLERALAQVPTSVPAAAAPACQEPR